jgi:hypothetical protein
MPPSRKKIDRATVAENGNHRSQYLIFPEGMVVVAERVAAGDETIAGFAGQPMGDKLLIAEAQHDPAGQ